MRNWEEERGCEDCSMEKKPSHGLVWLDLKASSKKVKHLSNHLDVKSIFC